MGSQMSMTILCIRSQVTLLLMVCKDAEGNAYNRKSFLLPYRNDQMQTRHVLNEINCDLAGETHEQIACRKAHLEWCKVPEISNSTTATSGIAGYTNEQPPDPCGSLQSCTIGYDAKLNSGRETSQEPQVSAAAWTAMLQSQWQSSW